MQAPLQQRVAFFSDVFALLLALEQLSELLVDDCLRLLCLCGDVAGKCVGQFQIGKRDFELRRSSGEQLRVGCRAAQLFSEPLDSLRSILADGLGILDNLLKLAVEQEGRAVGCGQRFLILDNRLGRDVEVFADLVEPVARLLAECLL